MGTLRNNSSATNITIATEEPDRFNQEAEIRRLIATIAFWLIVTVGILGNSLVIVVVKTIRSMRTTTNYLLVNVAVADITTLLFTAILFLILTTNIPIRSTVIAAFLCKFILTNTVSIVTLLVTALTLTMLAIERYHALVKPMSLSGRLSMDNISYVIAGIWLLAITLVTPIFATFDWDSEMRYCSHGKAEHTMMIYVDCLIIFLTLIPFAVISFCYSRIVYGMYFNNTVFGRNSERCDTQEETNEKRRLVTLLILLTVVFFIAFIPYGILLILKVSKVNHTYGHLQIGSQYLTLLNCSINPFIYAFQSSSYRRAFKLIIKKMLCRDVSYELSELLEMRTRTSVRSV